MQIKLTECPRDAMQGLDAFIPTELKAKYINAILKVGFDVVDFGSFVSHMAIPQLKDTVDVLNLLDLSETKSKLLTIVANERGASEAVAFEWLGLVEALHRGGTLRAHGVGFAADFCVARAKQGRRGGPGDLCFLQLLVEIEQSVTVAVDLARDGPVALHFGAAAVPHAVVGVHHAIDVNGDCLVAVELAVSGHFSELTVLACGV